MQLAKNYSKELIKAAVQLLQVVCPEVNVSSLVAALRNYESEKSPRSPELLTIKEVSKILSVSTITVRRYMASGILHQVKIPNTRFVRIPREAVNELLLADYGT